MAVVVSACVFAGGRDDRVGVRPRIEADSGRPHPKRSARTRGSPSELPELVSLYTHLHTHPELSRQEVETSKRIADELTKAGAEVTPNVGKLGVVGVLKNGDGPVVLVRTDMDALPVVEETGLPYASKVKTRDKSGREVGVMHACGHDIHMTSFIGTARWLADHRDRWSGTVVMVGSAGRGGRRRRPGDARRRAVFPVPQARLRPGAPLPARTSRSEPSATAPGRRWRARRRSASPFGARGAMAPGRTARSTRSCWRRS